MIYSRFGLSASRRTRKRCELKLSYILMQQMACDQLFIEPPAIPNSDNGWFELLKGLVESTI
jgi:hypothetical protein